MFSGVRTSLPHGIVDQSDGHLPTQQDRYPKVDLQSCHFGICTQFAVNQFDFHGAKDVFVHNRNFSSTELDVALHKCNCGVSQVEVGSVSTVTK